MAKQIAVVDTCSVPSLDLVLHNLDFVVHFTFTDKNYKEREKEEEEKRQREL